MKRKGRRRDFHDSLLNMLYAPPTPSPPPREESQERILDVAREIIINPDHPINTSELEGGEEKSSSSSIGDEDELGSRKLTRAQRKRLRKKKLKDAVSQRRKIIGPQLPRTSTNDDDAVNRAEDNVAACDQGVRQNAAEELVGKNDLGLEAASCTKVKLRRMSKKQARGKPKSPPTDFTIEVPGLSDHNETTIH